MARPSQWRAGIDTTPPGLTLSIAMATALAVPAASMTTSYSPEAAVPAPRRSPASTWFRWRAERSTSAPAARATATEARPIIPPPITSTR
ncbi:MAG TPA: hypothetical protein DDZ64_10005 [Acidimicrobiaceae bacterium]|nr:hypothetical protein [Acidimicrobiaceae bacterium]